MKTPKTALWVAIVLVGPLAIGLGWAALAMPPVPESDTHSGSTPATAASHDGDPSTDHEPATTNHPAPSAPTGTATNTASASKPAAVPAKPIGSGSGTSPYSTPTASTPAPVKTLAKPGEKPATSGKSAAPTASKSTPSAHPLTASPAGETKTAAPDAVTSAGATPAATPSAPPSAEQALKMLQEGNARWASSACTNPNTETALRASLAEGGQHPFATILTCSDSRLPVERMFDCGVGDVFVIRVAGNVISSDEAGTIEYGIEHLHTPVLVVMGHTKCGAVSAAATDAPVEGNILKLVSHIEPAVERAHRKHPDLEGKELVSEAVRENVWQSVFDLLKSSDTCREMLKEGKLKIVGAVCDIADGSVEWLGEHPWQDELVDALSERRELDDSASHKPTLQTAGHPSDE